MKSGLDAKPLFLQVDMLNDDFFTQYLFVNKKGVIWWIFMMIWEQENKSERKK